MCLFSFFLRSSSLWDLARPRELHTAKKKEGQTQHSIPE